MVSVAEIVQEEKYRQVFGDIKNECKKYGHVSKLMIPRPGYVQGDFGLGKVFVLFEHIESAIRAKNAFAHKKFDDNEILSSFYDEHKFARCNF